MKHFNRDSRDYEFTDHLVAGLVLTGAEAKSLRVHGVQFNGSKVEVVNGIPTIFNITLQPYKYAANQLADKTTERRLLLNSKEIAKIISLRHQKYMIIPVSIFLQGKWFKVDLGIGRKMRKYEKRDKIKKEEMKKSGY